MAIDTAPVLRGLAEGIPQDWPRLAAYLSQHGLELRTDPPPRQFAGGLANLNYLVLLNGSEAVLRRPPPGELPPGAYDMSREFRIVSSLSQSLELVPRAIHLCKDPQVLGAPFQIQEYRRGCAVRGDTLPAALLEVPDIGPRLSRTLIDTLVRIHRVDPVKAGLGELGRPQGFLSRTVEGWIKRVTLAADPQPPTIAMLSGWLRDNCVADASPVLIHNDLKLDNLLLDGATLEPVAVLDWDQCTRGDALFDLATTLSYWVEPGDPEGVQRLRQLPTARYGFLSRRQAAEAYAAATGADLSGFRFHRVLALYKLAGIFYQLHARYRQGATHDPRYAGFGRIADGVMEFAALVACGSLF
ncbi:MAG: phosphotransferase family protein [Nevskia sp.]|nr:phosphotransferase family protein [Nevskia sp.]